MNFKRIFQQIIDFFEKEQISYALIGAFALKAYGYVRATQDLDFLIKAEEQEKVIRYLESIGYETLHRSAPGVDAKVIEGYFQKYGQMGKFHEVVGEKQRDQ